MTDFLGPASNTPNVTTSRPSDTRLFGATDTWFKACTSASAGDGTRVQDAFLNGLIAQLRVAIRGNGDLGAGGPVVPEDNADAMLLTSILSMIQRNKPRVYTDSGTANALVSSGGIVAPELVNGMEVIVFVAFENTGAATFTHGGVTKPIVRNGAALKGGEMRQLIPAHLCYGSTADAWHLVNAANYSGPARIVTASGAFETFVSDSKIGLNRTVSPAASSTILPDATPVSHEYEYFDLAGNFNDYPLTITPPVGHTIAGLPSVTLNGDRQSIRIPYFGDSVWGINL
jgi:hypothetical protein